MQSKTDIRTWPIADERRTALLALTTAGLLFGLTVPLSKLALGWLDPAWLNVARFGLAAPVLLVLARRALRSAWDIRVVLVGAAGYGGMLWLQNLGVERTSVTHAALIFGAVPVLVALFALATGRASARALTWAGFALALGGVALVAGTGGESSLAGDALVLASAALSAAFIVAQSRLLPGRDAIAVTAVQMTAAGAATLPLALLGAAPAAPAGATELIAVIALVGLGTLLPFTLYAFGQTRVPAELAGSFVNLEPVVGVVIGVLAFGNPFGALQAAGAVAVLAGIGLTLVPEGAEPRGQRGARAYVNGGIEGSGLSCSREPSVSDGNRLEVEVASPNSG